MDRALYSPWSRPFFLIDDSSTDNSVDILSQYIENGIVTLFRENCDYFIGRQMHLSSL